MIIALLGVAMAADQAVPPSLNTYRGQAFTLAPGDGRVGLFSQAAIGLTDSLELSTPGLSTLVSPQVSLKGRLVGNDEQALSLYGGVGVPTLGLKLLQGTALSEAETVGFGVVGHVGVIGSVRRGDVTVSGGLTGRIDVKSAAWTLQPPDMPWLNPTLSPLTEGPAHMTARLAVDWFPGGGLHKHAVGLTVDTKVHIGGLGPDLDGRLLGQVGLGHHLSLAAGTAVGAERIPLGIMTMMTPLVDVIGRW